MKLPDGWVEVPFGDCGELINGRAYKQEELLSEGTPVLRIQNLNGGTNWYYSDLELPDDKYCKAGDLLYAWSATFGPYRYTGPLAIFHYHIWNVRTSAALNREFGFWLLKEITEEVKGAAHGVTMPHMTKAGMEKWTVRLPPLNEQRRIVDKIEALTARSRRAKEALDAVPALLDKLRQSILAAAFRGDLTKEWRAAHPDVEPASVLLTRIRKERRARWEEAELAKMRAKGSLPKDDKWKSKYVEPEPVNTDDLPELPEGWAWASVSLLLCEPLSNGRSVPTRDDGFPVLRLTCLKNGRIDLRERKGGDWTASEAKNFLVGHGDFLISRGNGSLSLVGRGGLVLESPDPVAYPDTLIRIRTIDLIKRQYLSRAWESQLVREQVERSAKTTAGIYKISQADVEGVVLPIPPLDEQAALVEAVSAMMVRLECLATAHLDAIKNTETLNSAILAKAFRGELVPQDPNDEPASALLERIRAERESAATTSPTKKTRAKRATKTSKSASR